MVLLIFFIWICFSMCLFNVHLFYSRFTGVFEAATIHYAVAKIFGPLVFGRGWCGCSVANVLFNIIYLNGKVCNYEKDGQGFHIFCFVIWLEYEFIMCRMLCSVYSFWHGSGKLESWSHSKISFSLSFLHCSMSSRYKFSTRLGRKTCRSFSSLLSNPFI